MQELKYKNILTKDYLLNEYIANKKSTPQIAIINSCNTATVREYLQRYKIRCRPLSESQKLYKHNKHKKTYMVNRQQLEDLYLNKKMSIGKIAKYLKCSDSLIYVRMLEYNIPLRSRSEANKGISRGKGELNHRWKGGRNIGSDGYVMVYCPEHPNSIGGNYVAEHRLVMEKKIGRYLSSNEIVHHLNGIRDDNRTENLEIVDRSKHERNTLLKLAQKRIRELESKE